MASGVCYKPFNSLEHLGLYNSKKHGESKSMVTKPIDVIVWNRLKES